MNAVPKVMIVEMENVEELKLDCDVFVMLVISIIHHYEDVKVRLLYHVKSVLRISSAHNKGEPARYKHCPNFA